MSHRDGMVFVAAPELPQQCDLCGAIAELRPYGPHGEAICFECGMADPEATEAAFRPRLAGVEVVVVLAGEP